MGVLIVLRVALQQLELSEQLLQLFLYITYLFHRDVAHAIIITEPLGISPTSSRRLSPRVIHSDPGKMV